MTTTLTPGVYFRATDAAPRATPRTGVPAFIGRSGSARLDAAVRAFVANGGQQCSTVFLDDGSPEALDRALAGLEDVDLVCLPDLVTVAAWTDQDVLAPVVARQRQVLDHCAARGDRFAILDAVPSPSAATVIAHRGALTGPSAAHGALYAPWLLTDDGNLAPPCGAVAGVYASVDETSGTQRAPAGVELEQVLDVQVGWDADDLATLTSGGVNVVRALPGRGFRVWGARTASDDPAWRDVTARRVVGEIVRRLEEFMAGLTHEPNDTRLRVRIRRELTAYLTGLHRRGALRGAAPGEAFFVKCDDETNPPEVVALGQVVTRIGVSLAAQAELIVLDVVRTSDGTTVQV